MKSTRHPVHNTTHQPSLVKYRLAVVLAPSFLMFKCSVLSKTKSAVPILFLVGIFKGELMDGGVSNTRLLAWLLLYFIYKRSVHGLDTQCVRELCWRLQYSARRCIGKAVCWKLTCFQSLDARFRWQID